MLGRAVAEDEDADADADADAAAVEEEEEVGWVLPARPRCSLVGDWAVREEMERGQDTERRIDPDREGEAAGRIRTVFKRGFPFTRPVDRTEEKEGEEEKGE